MKPLARWLALLIITNSDEQNSKPMSLAIIRARMCELLSLRAGHGKPSYYFTAGLFSMLDSILSITMKDAIEHIPLSDEICAALTERKGSMGNAINCIQAYEDCRWEDVTFKGVDIDDVIDIYTESINWVKNAKKMV